MFIYQVLNFSAVSVKQKKPSRKGWFCGEYRPDGSGEPMFIYQVLNFSAVSAKQKNHPVKDGLVENIAPMGRGNRCSFIRF